MIDRALYYIAFSPDWGRQMRWITGPRQCGKTTLAKMKLKEENSSDLYYLWDLRSVRNRYKENELFFTQDRLPTKQGQKFWLCFDEIHKMPKWKNILKAIFDSSFEKYNFIITGSAKLNVVRRAGDSLSGRYFTFNLMPLSLSELNNAKLFCEPVDKSAERFIQKKIDNGKNSNSKLDVLLNYSGFPEPFLKQSKKFYAKWSQEHLDTIIKEDIGSLTRIIDREYLYDLYKLLPEMVGNPISLSSLASHIEVSPATIKNYLKRLEDFYLIFKIHPYSKNIKRALLKAPKVYLYDYTAIEDPADRFENYVAVELKTHLHLYKDATGEDFSLFYLRNKQKQETDFLITRNKKPWLLIECKYSDTSIAKHHFQMRESLSNIPFIQLCQQKDICLMQAKNVYRISASRFF